MVAAGSRLRVEQQAAADNNKVSNNDALVKVLRLQGQEMCRREAARTYGASIAPARAIAGAHACIQSFPRISGRVFCERSRDTLRQLVPTSQL